jgi:hypothetical protein
MKPDKVAIPDVQKLKFRRDELFREFEYHPGKLGVRPNKSKSLTIRLLNLAWARKRHGLNFPVARRLVQACANSESRKPNVVS